MQDARKVVSSPRWQTQSKEERDEASIATPSRDTANEEAGTPPTPLSGADIAASLPQSENSIDPARGELAAADDAGKLLDDEKADEPPQTEHDWTPSAPMPSARQPLLMLTAACAAAAAIWSYSTLESTRAQLNNVTLAKQTLERSLAEAQSRLSVAEKTVADVKAAITAATSPSKAATPAAK